MEELEGRKKTGEVDKPREQAKISPMHRSPGFQDLY